MWFDVAAEHLINMSLVLMIFFTLCLPTCRSTGLWLAGPSRT
uniref:Uncharacterized protein n=1 Tax=Aegilops tauschii subsp. strangulata TaxID=200361 RepID=A0A453A9I0_AEGTS